jgi:hypothetical protein
MQPRYVLGTIAFTLGDILAPAIPKELASAQSLARLYELAGDFSVDEIMELRAEAELKQHALLERADQLLALGVELGLQVPVHPIVPSPEGVVVFGIPVNRVLAVLIAHSHAAMLSYVSV